MGRREFVKGNAIIKHVGSNFTLVPNHILNNKELSFRAKGLYAYLRSKPEDWEFRVQNIIKASAEGRDAVQTAIKELEAAGYVQRIAFRSTKTGQYNGMLWYIYESPVVRHSHRQPGNPSNG